MKRTWIAICIAVVAIAGLGLLPSDRKSALRSTGSEVTSAARGAARELGTRSARPPATEAEIRELKERIAHMEARNHTLRGHESENRFLKKLLAMRKASSLTLLACRVVARDDATGWYEALELDRGRTDGIEDGMAVIDINGALVGRVRQAHRRSCAVELITAPEAKVPCLLPNSGTPCFLNGGERTTEATRRRAMLCPPPSTSLSPVTSLSGIQVGDPVHTSGFGRDLPGGLFVGLVASVAETDAPGVLKAEVELGAELQRLQYVFAVLDSGT